MEVPYIRLQYYIVFVSVNYFSSSDFRISYLWRTPPQLVTCFRYPEGCRECTCTFRRLSLWRNWRPETNPDRMPSEWWRREKWCGHFSSTEPGWQQDWPALDNESDHVTIEVNTVWRACFLHWVNLKQKNCKYSIHNYVKIEKKLKYLHSVTFM